MRRAGSAVTTRRPRVGSAYSDPVEGHEVGRRRLNIPPESGVIGTNFPRLRSVWVGPGPGPPPNIEVPMNDVADHRSAGDVSAEVNVRALEQPPEIVAVGRPGRRRRVLSAVAVTAAVALAGGDCGGSGR